MSDLRCRGLYCPECIPGIQSQALCCAGIHLLGHNTGGCKRTAGIAVLGIKRHRIAYSITKIPLYGSMSDANSRLQAFELRSGFERNRNVTPTALAFIARKRFPSRPTPPCTSGDCVIRINTLVAVLDEFGQIILNRQHGIVNVISDINPTMRASHSSLFAYRCASCHDRKRSQTIETRQYEIPIDSA